MDTQKFIHSVKLHILHQMKPYSRVKTNWELSDTCISIFGELGKSEKLGPNVLNHGHQYTESHHQVLNSTFHIKSSLPKIQIPFEGWFMPVLVYLAHWGKSGNLRPNTQIHGHVIQSVKLHISHQMKPYSNVKAIWESIYTCFCVSVELGQVSYIRPVSLKSWTSIYWKSSKMLHSTFHIKWSLTEV